MAEIGTLVLVKNTLVLHISLRHARILTPQAEDLFLHKCDAVGPGFFFTIFRIELIVNGRGFFLDPSVPE